MCVPKPHFLLYSQAAQSSDSHDWRFILETVDGSQKFEAADFEPDIQGERLELLAVVRGLEALDQPSHVTLVTSSSYVARGIEQGLDAWRENDWQWEHFDEMVPVKNRDLWQRIDRALQFHLVECRYERPSGATPVGFCEPPFTTVVAEPLRARPVRRFDRPERGRWQTLKVLARRRWRQMANRWRRTV